MEPVSLPVQTLYAELLDLAGTEAMQGSLYWRTIKGQEYAYLKVPYPQGRKDVFVGNANDAETRIKLARLEDAAARLAQRRELVGLLASARLPQAPVAHARVVEALNQAGLLEEVVIVGTMAYLSYPALVGFHLPGSALTTQDTDVATAQLLLKSREENQSLLSILQMADDSFRALPQHDSRALPSRFRSKTGWGVDVLTPQRRRSDINPMPLKNLAAGATPLQYLDWLVADPIEALVLRKAGLKIKVPQPSRFAVHKLILAQRRTNDRIKRQKDLLQAKSLMAALRKHDPSLLEATMNDALARGKKGWAEPIQHSLREIGETAA